MADSPFGPFKDALGHPLIKRSYGYIDPTVFIDQDGQAYLYWGNPHLWYVKLNKDMISYSGHITQVSAPKHYQEGPWFYQRDGHYYMAYASTCCPEGIGYAMSDSPTGPWAYKGYIMKPNPRSSGNHPGIIDYKGGSYVFGFNYALNYALTKKHHERRSVCVAQFLYNADGTIPVVPWWNPAGVQQIGTFNPYVQTQAATICWEQGVKTESRAGHKQGVYVSVNDEDAYIKVKGVDFGQAGAVKFTARLACATGGGQIVLRLDSPSGRRIGSLPVKSSGSLEKWQTQSGLVRGAKGVHDLYFKFTGVSRPLHFDWWQFEQKQ